MLQLPGRGQASPLQYTVGVPLVYCRGEACPRPGALDYTLFFLPRFLENPYTRSAIVSTAAMTSLSTGFCLKYNTSLGTSERASGVRLTPSYTSRSIW